LPSCDFQHIYVNMRDKFALCALFCQKYIKFLITVFFVRLCTIMVCSKTCECSTHNTYTKSAPKKFQKWKKRQLFRMTPQKKSNQNSNVLSIDIISLRNTYKCNLFFSAREFINNKKHCKTYTYEHSITVIMMIKRHSKHFNNSLKHVVRNKSHRNHFNNIFLLHRTSMKINNWWQKCLHC
jgi:hypothetical protein